MTNTTTDAAEARANMAQSDASALIAEAAKLIAPAKGEVVFYLRVDGEHTHLQIKTNGDVDPNYALSQAINTLQAERRSLGTCPAHKIASGAGEREDDDDYFDARYEFAGLPRPASLPPATDPAMGLDRATIERCAKVVERCAIGPVGRRWSVTSAAREDISAAIRALAAAPTIPATGEEASEDERPLTAKEQAMIDAAWERHKAARPCTIPPEGWRCTRTGGHDGPCAAVPTIPATQPDGWTDAGRAWLAAGAPAFPATGEAEQ